MLEARVYSFLRFCHVMNNQGNISGEPTPGPFRVGYLGIPAPHRPTTFGTHLAHQRLENPRKTLLVE